MGVGRYGQAMSESQETQPSTARTVVRWTARILFVAAVIYFAFKIGGVFAI